MTEKNHEGTNVDHKHHVTKENTFDKVDGKLDAQMHKLMKTGLVEKVLGNKIVKDTLGSKFVNDLDIKLKPYLKNFFTVIGRLAVVGGILGVVSSLSALGLFFRRNFGVSYLLFVLISLVFSLLALVTGYGMIKFKKRVIFVALIELGLSALSFLMTIFSSGNFGSTIFNLLLSILLTIIIFKNKDMFKN